MSANANTQADPYALLLDEKALGLWPEDDAYEERLREIVGLFRTFGDALTAFIANCGYAGDTGDARQKAAFVSERLEAVGAPVPRSVASWFATPGTRPNRRRAFALCFAFGLDVERSEAFFRTVYLERGFDCHTPEEAVWYFCLRNGLSYARASELVAGLPSVRPGRIEGAGDVLYTATIKDRINGMRSGEELLAYLTENADRFAYNNVTATELVRKLWDAISREGGLANREAELLLASSGYADADPSRDEDAPSSSARNSNSTWVTYTQVMGLDRLSSAQLGSDRTLSGVLKSNELLHPFAETSFPDRGGLQKILNGDHVSHERVRKQLVLLTFYAFWARKAAAKKTDPYAAAYGDGERCLTEMNAQLTDVGYPQLYAGNPYDWIFLWALSDDRPLLAFRHFMATLSAVKSEGAAGADEA